MTTQRSVGKQVIGIVTLLVGLVLATVWLIAVSSGPLNRRATALELASGAVGSRDTVITETIYLPLVIRNYDPEYLPPFGIEMGAITDANGLQQAREAEMKWVRYNAIRWDVVQPDGPGTYNWSALSNVEADLIRARQSGLRPIVIIRGTPSWAQKVPGYFCGPIKQENLDEFANFLRALTQRYKDSPYNIKYWELGNEPDAPWDVLGTNSGFGCWGDGNDTSGFGGGHYAEMLKQAYPAIKSADPQAQVLIGGLLYDWKDPHNRPMINFLRGVLVNGGGDYFDILSYHSYHYDGRWAAWGGGLVGKTNHIKQVLAEYGYASKPMMCTESAYRTFGDDSLLEEQANFVVTDYIRGFALGLKTYVWYGLKTNDFSGSALLYPDSSPKPAYIAYKVMTHELEEWFYNREMTAAETGYADVKGHIFRKGSQSKWVLWATDDVGRDVSFAVSLSPSGQFRVVDRAGNAQTRSDGDDGSTDNKVTIFVGDSPVYVETVP